LLYLIIGGIGGYFLYAINFPAGGIIGSLVAVCLARLGGVDFGAPPQILRTLAQVGLGLVVGVSFNEQTLVELQTDLVPILLVTLATVGSGVLLAGVVQRRLGTDLQTALLACAPGGVIQMTVIADELGSDAVMVNVVQLARLVTTIVLFPIFVRLVVGG
jgi:membrane AbrB-like protein